jgi:hypothetical protein
LLAEGASGTGKVSQQKASSTTARKEDTDPSTTYLIKWWSNEAACLLHCSISNVVFNDDLNRRIRNRTSGGVGGRG